MISINWIVFFLGLCFLSTASAQLPLFGACPDVKVQENFNLAKFLGVWYEVERTMSFLELTAKCVQFTLSPTDYNDSTTEVVNEGKTLVLGLDRKVRLIATTPNLTEPAKMELRLNDLTLKGNFWVLKTDYTNYALVWSCNYIWLTFKKTRTENLWLLSRKRELPKETRDTLAEFLKKNNIKSRKLLMSVKQSGCD